MRRALQLWQRPTVLAAQPASSFYYLLNQGIYMCQDCHRHIHATYDEMRLATEYSTPDALINDPVLQRHFLWLARQRRRTSLSIDERGDRS